VARTLKVCLVSPAPPGVNLRLRNAADALRGAGYDVTVGHGAPLNRLTAALRQRFAKNDAEAYWPGYPALLDWATAQRADLYIAHTQPALAVAAEAAAANGARFAFDCEDLLAEENTNGLRSSPRQALVRRLERTYIPRAAFVSASSRPMAELLARQYSLPCVHVWHNCWPASQVVGLVPPAERAVSETIDLVWIGTTTDRKSGLQDVRAVLSSLDPRVRLCLYGDVRMPAASEWMATLARHHVGLALDRGDSLNSHLTVGSTLFLYLQAGLACVATDSPGNVSVLGRHATYSPGDTKALAAILRALTDPDPCVLAEQRAAAWELGQTTYTWDAEQSMLLNAVASVFESG
jgi:hypothetical protein